MSALLLSLVGLAPGTRAADTANSAAAEISFEEHVRPIFRAHCFDCHGSTDERQGGLDLRLVRFIARGGESGPAIVPGRPDESYLLERVRNGEMPPGENRVSRAEIAILEKWLTEGAPTKRAEPEEIGAGLGITLEERRYWAFQPVRRAALPDSTELLIARNAIDALLQEAMPAGLTFSPDAERFVLIKRLYLQLIGLPPSTAELRYWLDWPQANWYERLVDHLLASPHYGERWARHWLDIAGYADSEGYTNADAARPWAWKYRDYVVRSLNQDKPFDHFLIEQLAGDELAGPRDGDWDAEQIELLTATGFLRMAADGTGSGADSPEGRNQVMADTLRIVSSGLLGLSVGCAQCHDHRYDPILQTDYYALRAVFEPALDWQRWRTPAQRLISLHTAADRKLAAEIEAEAEKIVAAKNKKQQEYMAQALTQELQKQPAPLRRRLREAYETPQKKRSAEQQKLLQRYPSLNITPGVLYQYLPQAAEDLKKYDARIAEVRSNRPPEEFLRALVEPAGTAAETRLFHRGDHRQPKQIVVPAALTVFSEPGAARIFAVNDSATSTTGRRLAYARWLTSGEHPLVARVLVNRVWMHHFGRGLVSTPADFGKLGGRPSHPQLLDWLADEFVRQGWSLKRLHRLILSSTAWRQAARGDPEKEAVDPNNQFYWRKPLLRLEAEALRDRMLAASGQLERTLFGPAVDIKVDDSGQVVVAGEKTTRRSLYVRVRRSQPVALLQAFDAPVMVTNCESRTVSTAATQSLMLMNGQFMLEQAQELALRSLAEGAAQGEPPAETARQLVAQIVRAWERALCRRPSSQELQMATAFVDRQLETIRSTKAALPKGVSRHEQALSNLCQALLSSNEFMYVD